MLHRATPRFTTWFALVLALSCGGDSAPCTELDCSSSAEVTYSKAVAGPYDLQLDVDGVTLARCSDPGALESQDNPEWLECGPTGFRISDPEAARSSVVVTITLVDPDMTQPIRAQLVDLVADPDAVIEPNGPGCPPQCFERLGELLFPAP